MAIQKFTVSNDPDIYEAWPDVVLANPEKMVCVFSECTHHGNRSYTRVMLTESTDRGRTWTPKHPLTEGTAGKDYYYNCARINCLSDGRLVITIDRVFHKNDESKEQNAQVLLYFSADEGNTWEGPFSTPMNGIVPDKLIELPGGRLIVSAHYRSNGRLAQFMHYSDDGGESWSRRITVAESPQFNLCEVSMLPLGGNTVVAFLRENSLVGYDCKKVISYDRGNTWGKIIDFPLPGCHRPTAGMLNDGKILITYRFHQGGKGWLGSWTQNFFAAVTDRASVLAENRGESSARILPVDFDRSPKSDLGYSGWVQFADGEIYIVNYIVDDAWDKAQIRGYSLRMNDFFCDSGRKEADQCVS